MRVTGVTPFTGPAANRAEPQAARPVPQTTPERASGAALVPVAPPSAHRLVSRSGRPDAAFVVHLIATADRAPQTRSLRRAAPGDAVTRYRVAGETSTANATARISRTA